MVTDARMLELCLKYGDEEMAASLRQRAYYGARPHPNMSAEDLNLGDGELSPANMTRASETILLLDPDSPRTTPRNSFSGDAGLLLLAQHAQRYGPAAADAAASAPPAALDAVGRALSGTGAELTSPPEGVSPLQRSGSQSSRRSESSVSQLRAPPDAGSPRSPRSPRSPSIAEAAPPPAAPAPEVPCPSFTADELEALKAGCAFAEFGPTHELALAYMRWRRDEALAAGGGGEPLSTEFASDIRLVRFLAACGWEPRAAADMYVEALLWRAEQRMDEVREQLVRANAAFFVHGGEALSEVVATAHDAAVQAVQPRTFTRLLPGGGGHAPLLDRQGNLVCIECPGLVDNAGIAALGTAAWARSYLCGVELGVLVIDELSRRQGRLVRTLHRAPPGPTTVLTALLAHSPSHAPAYRCSCSAAST